MSTLYPKSQIEFRRPQKTGRLKKAAIAVGGIAATGGAVIAGRKIGGGAVRPVRSMAQKMPRKIQGAASKMPSGVRRRGIPAQRTLSLPSAGQSLGAGLSKQRRRVAVLTASSNNADFIGYEQGVALRRKIGSTVGSARSKASSFGKKVGGTKLGSTASGAARKVGGFVKRNPVKAGAIGAGAYLGYKAVKAGAKRVLGMGRKRRPNDLRGRIRNAFS